LLAPRLTPENAQELISAASRKTRFQIETLIAERFPRSDAPQKVTSVRTRETDDAEVQSLELSADPVDSDSTASAQGHLPPSDAPPIDPATSTSTRNLPAARPVAQTVAPSRSSPISRGRFKLQLTIGQSALDDLHRAQALLSHQIPTGDLEKIFERALRLLVKRLEKQKYATTSKPRGSNGTSRNPRVIPADVRRAVRLRDGDQCTFVGSGGHRCTERRFLEFDHVLEVARGGSATVDGIRLRCRAHNQYTAECTFGAVFMNDKRPMARVAMKDVSPALRGRS
jgi:hypothetical protein